MLDSLIGEFRDSKVLKCLVGIYLTDAFGFVVKVVDKLPVVAHGDMGDVGGALKVVAVRAFERNKVKLENKNKNKARN